MFGKEQQPPVMFRLSLGLTGGRLQLDVCVHYNLSPVAQTFVCQKRHRSNSSPVVGFSFLRLPLHRFPERFSSSVVTF